MLNIVLQAILAVGLAVVAYFDVGGCLSAFSTTQFLSSSTPFFLFTTYRAVTPTSEDWALGPAFTKALSPFAASTSPISSTYFHSNDIIPADEDAVISSTPSASSFPAVIDMTAHDILSNMGTHSNDIIPADEDAVISSTASAPSFPAVVDVTAHEIPNNISTKSVHRAAPHGPRTSWIARKIVSLTSLKVYAVLTIIAALVFQVVLLVAVVGFQRFMSVDVLGLMDLDGPRAEQDSDDLGIETLPLQGDHVLVEDEDDFMETPKDANGSTASDLVFQTHSGYHSAQRVDMMVDKTGVPGNILGRTDLQASREKQDSDVLGETVVRGVGLDAGMGAEAMDILASVPEDGSMASDVIFRTDPSDRRVVVVAETMVPGGRDDVLGQMHLDAFEADQDLDGLDMDMLPPQGGRVVLEDQEESTRTRNDTATDVIFRTDDGCDSDQRIEVMIEETIALLDRMGMGASRAQQESNDLGADKLPLRHGHVVIEEEDERKDKAIFRTDSDCYSAQRLMVMIDEMIEEWGGGIDNRSYQSFVMQVAMASKTFPRDNGEDDGRGDVLWKDKLEQSVDEENVSSGSLARIEDCLEKAIADGDVMPLPSADEYDGNSGEEGFEKAFFGDKDDSFTLGRMEIDPRFLERLIDVELPKDSDVSCDFDSDGLSAASPVLSPVEICTEAVGSENAVINTVTPKDGGGIFRENKVEKGDDKVVLSSNVPWHTAADEDIIGPLFLMTSTPLHFGSRTAPADFMQPSASPRRHGPQRPFAHPLFDGHDLEVVRRITTQDKRQPLRDLAQDRFPNQPAFVRAQKPLPLPVGPPSPPFEGKSHGAGKRRHRREAREAQRLEEGVL